MSDYDTSQIASEIFQRCLNEFNSRPNTTTAVSLGSAAVLLASQLGHLVPGVVFSTDAFITAFTCDVPVDKQEKFRKHLAYHSIMLAIGEITFMSSDHSLTKLAVLNNKIGELASFHRHKVYAFSVGAKVLSDNIRKHLQMWSPASGPIRKETLLQVLNEVRQDHTDPKTIE